MEVREKGGDFPPQVKAPPPASSTPADFPAKKLARQLDFNAFGGASASEQGKPPSQDEFHPQPPPLSPAIQPLPPPQRQPQNQNRSQQPQLVVVGPVLPQQVASSEAHSSMRVDCS